MYRGGYRRPPQQGSHDYDSREMPYHASTHGYHGYDEDDGAPFEVSHDRHGQRPPQSDVNSPSRTSSEGRRPRRSSRWDNQTSEEKGWSRDRDRDERFKDDGHSYDYRKREPHRDGTEPYRGDRDERGNRDLYHNVNTDSYGRDERDKRDSYDQHEGNPYQESWDSHGLRERDSNHDGRSLYGREQDTFNTDSSNPRVRDPFQANSDSLGSDPYRENRGSQNRDTHRENMDSHDRDPYRDTRNFQDRDCYRDRDSRDPYNRDDRDPYNGDRDLRRDSHSNNPESNHDRGDAFNRDNHEELNRDKKFHQNTDDRKRHFREEPHQKDRESDSPEERTRLHGSASKQEEVGDEEKPERRDPHDLRGAKVMKLTVQGLEQCLQYLQPSNGDPIVYFDFESGMHCPACPPSKSSHAITWQTRAKFAAHWQSSHLPMVCLFSCTMCDIQLKRISDIGRHIRRNHDPSFTQQGVPTQFRNSIEKNTGYVDPNPFYYVGYVPGAWDNGLCRQVYTSGTNEDGDPKPRLQLSAECADWSVQDIYNYLNSLTQVESNVIFRSSPKDGEFYKMISADDGQNVESKDPHDLRGAKVMKLTVQGLEQCLHYLQPSNGNTIVYFDFESGMHCPACPPSKNSYGITWQARTKFATHWYSSHLPLVRIFSCNACDMQFKRITDIGRHIRRTHDPSYTHRHGDTTQFRTSIDKSTIYIDPDPFYYVGYIPGEWDNGVCRQVDTSGTGEDGDSKPRLQLSTACAHWSVEDIYNYLNSLTQVESNVIFRSSLKDQEFYEMRLKQAGSEDTQRPEESSGTPANALESLMSMYTEPKLAQPAPSPLAMPGSTAYLQEAVHWELDERPHKGALIVKPGYVVKNRNLALFYLRDVVSTTFFYFKSGMRCPVCPSDIFGRLGDFEAHWLKMHMPLLESPKCMYCTETFPDMSEIGNHFRAVHKQSYPASYLEQMGISLQPDGIPHCMLEMVVNQAYIAPGKYHYFGAVKGGWDNGYVLQSGSVPASRQMPHLRPGYHEWGLQELNIHLNAIPQEGSSIKFDLVENPYGTLTRQDTEIMVELSGEESDTHLENCFPFSVMNLTAQLGWELDDRPHKGADLSMQTFEAESIDELYIFLRPTQPTSYFKFASGMRCPVCPSDVYEKELDFRWHWFSWHTWKARRMVCKQCSHSFRAVKFLKQHMLAAHPFEQFSHACYDLLLVENEEYINPGPYHYILMLGKEWTNGYCYENKRKMSLGTFCEGWSAEQVRSHLAAIPQVTTKTSEEPAADATKTSTPENSQKKESSSESSQKPGDFISPALLPSMKPSEMRWFRDERPHKGAKILTDCEVKLQEDAIGYLREKTPTTYFVFCRGMRCPACPTMPFKEKVFFNAHWWHMHTPEARRYPCSLCAQNFNTQKVLTQHYNDMHEKKGVVMAKLVKNGEYVDPGVYHYVDKLGKEWSSGYCKESLNTYSLGELCKNWSHVKVMAHLRDIPQEDSSVRFVSPGCLIKSTPIVEPSGTPERSVVKSGGLFGSNTGTWQSVDNSTRKKPLLEDPPTATDLKDPKNSQSQETTKIDSKTSEAGEKSAGKGTSADSEKGKVKPKRVWGPHLSPDVIRDWDLDGRHHKGAFLMMTNVTDVESAAIYLREIRPTTYFEFCPGMRCPVCPTPPIESLVQFQQHWYDYHLPRFIKYVCQLCNFSANRKNGILEHSITGHRGIYRAQNHFTQRVSYNHQFIDPEEYYFVSRLNSDWDNSYCREVAQQIQLSNKTENWTPKQIFNHFTSIKQIKSRVRFKFSIEDEVEAAEASTDEIVELWAADSRPHKGAFIPSAGVCDERLFLLYLCSKKKTTYFNFQPGMRCPVCPTEIFSKVLDFKYHWWDRHVQYTTQMKCLACDKTYKPLHPTLYSHYATEHPHLPKVTERRFVRDVSKNADFIETRGYHYCEEVYGGWDNGFCKQRGVRPEDSKLELSELYSNWTRRDILRHLQSVPQVASSVVFEQPKQEEPAIPSLFDINVEPLAKAGKDSVKAGGLEASDLDIWGGGEDDDDDEEMEFTDVADLASVPAFNKEQVRTYLTYLGLDAFRYHFGHHLLRKFYSGDEISVLEKHAKKFTEWLPAGISVEDVATYGLFRMNIAKHYKLKCVVCHKLAKDDKSFHVHTIGRKHAMVCLQKLTELGQNKYLNKYGNLPGPNTFHLSENHKLLVPEEVYPGHQTFDIGQHKSTGKPADTTAQASALATNAPWNSKSADPENSDLSPLKKLASSSTDVADILAEFVKSVKDSSSEEEKDLRVVQAPWMKSSSATDDSPIKKKEEKLMESAPWIVKDKPESSADELKELTLVENAPWIAGAETPKEKLLVENAPWLTGGAGKKFSKEESPKSKKSVAPVDKAADILADFVKNIKGIDSPKAPSGDIKCFPSEPSSSFDRTSTGPKAHRIYLSPRFKSGWTSKGFEKVFCMPGTLKSLVEEAVKYGKPHFAYFLFGEVDMIDMQSHGMRGTKESLIIELSECIHQAVVWLKKHHITPTFADVVPISFSTVNRKVAPEKGVNIQNQYNSTVRALNRIIHRINKDSGVEPIELCRDLLKDKSGKPFLDESRLIEGWLPKPDLQKEWTREISEAIKRNTVESAAAEDTSEKSGKENVHRVYVTPRFQGGWIPKTMEQVVMESGTLKEMVERAVAYGPHFAYFLFGDHDLTGEVKQNERTQYVFIGHETPDLVAKLSAAIVEAVLTCRSHDITPIFADIVPVAFHTWNHSIKPFYGAPFSEMQKEYNNVVVALNKVIYANNLKRDVGIIHLNQQIIVHRDGEPIFKFDNLVNGFTPNTMLKKLWKTELLDTMKLNKEKVIDKGKALAASAPWMLTGYDSDGDQDEPKAKPRKDERATPDKTESGARGRSGETSRQSSREKQSQRSRSRERQKRRSRSRSQERKSRGRRSRSHEKRSRSPERRPRERRSRSRERFGRRRRSPDRNRSRSPQRHDRERPPRGDKYGGPVYRDDRNPSWVEKQRRSKAAEVVDYPASSDDDVIQIGSILPHLDATTIKLFVNPEFQTKLQRLQRLVSHRKIRGGNKDGIEAEIKEMINSDLFRSGPVRKVLSLLGFENILSEESSEKTPTGKSVNPVREALERRWKEGVDCGVLSSEGQEVSDYGTPVTSGGQGASEPVKKPAAVKPGQGGLFGVSKSVAIAKKRELAQTKSDPVSVAGDLFDISVSSTEGEVDVSEAAGGHTDPDDDDIYDDMGDLAVPDEEANLPSSDLNPPEVTPALDPAEEKEEEKPIRSLFGAMKKKIVLIRSEKKTSQDASTDSTSSREKLQEKDDAPSTTAASEEIKPDISEKSGDAPVDIQKEKPVEKEISSPSPVDDQKETTTLVKKEIPSPSPVGQKEAPTKVKKEILSPSPVDDQVEKQTEVKKEIPSPTQEKKDNSSADSPVDAAKPATETASPTRASRKRGCKAGAAPVVASGGEGGAVEEEDDEPPAKQPRTRAGKTAAVSVTAEEPEPVKSTPTTRVTRTRAAQKQAGKSPAKANK